MKNKISRNGMTATRLPSGSWRVQITVNGKRKSITCGTYQECFEQAEDMKSCWERSNTQNLTVEEAMNQYISLREPVVSPATIATYRSYQRNHFQSLATVPIKNVDKHILQKLVNQMVQNGKSVKFMKSVIAFFTSVYNDVLEQNKAFKIVYPQSIKKEHYLPTESNLASLMVYLNEHDQQILKAMVISLVTNFRIGQVCALTGADLDRKNCLIRSYKAMVKSEDTWVIKAPKTDVSARYVLVPERTFDIIGPVEQDHLVIGLNPHVVSDRFVKAVARAELPHFVFHDLRHYNASMYHAMQIPEQYAIQRGGWSNTTVMNTVYTQTIATEQNKYDSMVNAAYEKILLQA